MSRIVILGAGTAGTILANRLQARLADDGRVDAVRITVVDENDRHVYQPGLLYVPFGLARPDAIVRPRGAQLDAAVEYVQRTIAHVDVAARRVTLDGGVELPYDVLVVATGTRTCPDDLEGLTGAGWRERMFDFYTLEGSAALAGALARFDGGRLVVNVVDLPIKCPVAPLEFAFLADWWATERGIRDRTTITYVTPLDGAFTKPVASQALTHLLREKRIELVTEFAAGSVDGEAGVLRSWDEREVPFDLLVTVPPHRGAAFVGRSAGLGDDLDFVRTDPHTLQSRCDPHVFALGDATDVPASKAGSVAHFEAEGLVDNVVRALEGLPPQPNFDGHANCFVETGHHKALLIDFNYDTEPLPGAFPYAYGPMRLLAESRINHVAKQAFEHVYWHVLLPGHDLPGVPTRLSMRGKHRPTADTTSPEPVESPA